MRPLTEPETKALFSKLANYLGRSLERLIAPVDKNSEKYVFRLHQSRCVLQKVEA
jgi:60S ribosome subunit biogenesis protein NIP7